MSADAPPDTIPAPPLRPRVVYDLSAGPAAEDIAAGLDERGREALEQCLRSADCPAARGLLGAA